MQLVGYVPPIKGHGEATKGMAKHTYKTIKSTQQSVVAAAKSCPRLAT